MSAGYILVELLEAGIATWRLSRMLVEEKGPGNIFENLREMSGIKHDAAGNIEYWTNEWTPLTCVFCTSIWSATVLALCPRIVRTVICISGLASWLELEVRKQPQFVKATNG